MPDQVGAIPSSDALAEVTLDSLSESISRFDQAVQAGLQSGPAARRDLERIIAANREQRVRWETAERERPQRGTRQILEKKSQRSASDLGL